MRQLPVRFREEAISDLDEVMTYLLDQGADVAVVQGFISRIRRQCEKVGDAPEGYPARSDLGPGIRIVPFERSAVIAYRIAADTVEIVNVFYGGRDYEALMK
jgi:toxin ParE1/3/4